MITTAPVTIYASRTAPNVDPTAPHRTTTVNVIDAATEAGTPKTRTITESLNLKVRLLMTSGVDVWDEELDVGRAVLMVEEQVNAVAARD